MKKFLITDPEHYSSNPQLFSIRFYRALKKNRPDVVIFRDKKSKNFKLIAKKCKKISKVFGIKEFYINQNIAIAQELNANGVQLTAKQQNLITNVKKMGLKTIVSTHSEDEVKKCSKKSANYILYSPIFYTRNKGKPKGLDGLKQIVDNISSKVIALGGIATDYEVDKLKIANPCGFASIRYFTKGI
ncbi:MAG: thiamine-phosphate pyrophosphorylase [Campylobacterota bacterium]|nr:thiamine-phosphate pyrophosphorylase [Campylobacterota bacterium]